MSFWWLASEVSQFSSISSFNQMFPAQTALEWSAKNTKHLKKDVVSLGLVQGLVFLWGFGNENQDMNRYSERSQSHPAIFSTISTVSPNIAQMFRGMCMYSSLLLKPQCLLVFDGLKCWCFTRNHTSWSLAGCRSYWYCARLSHPGGEGRSWEAWKCRRPDVAPAGCALNAWKQVVDLAFFFVSSFSEFEPNPSFKYPMMFHFINLTISNVFI